jgi:hypothetical protein
MKYIEPRPFADPDAAARKLTELGTLATAIVLTISHYPSRWRRNENAPS